MVYNKLSDYKEALSELIIKVLEYEKSKVRKDQLEKQKKLIELAKEKKERFGL